MQENYGGTTVQNAQRISDNFSNRPCTVLLSEFWRTKIRRRRKRSNGHIVDNNESQRTKRSAGIQKVEFFRRDDTKAPQHVLCTKSARGRARDKQREEKELMQPRPTANTRRTTKRERKREVYYATCRPGSATPEVSAIYKEAEFRLSNIHKKNKHEASIQTNVSLILESSLGPNTISQPSCSKSQVNKIAHQITS